MVRAPAARAQSCRGGPPLLCIPQAGAARSEPLPLLGAAPCDFARAPCPRAAAGLSWRSCVHRLVAEFVDAQTDKTITSYNPSNESAIATFQAATEADVNIAVAAAKEAFKPGSEWRSLTGAMRRDLMIKMADLVEKHRDEL